MGRVRTRLCADCAEKMRRLYKLREIPPEYERAGCGKCELCAFRGSLREYSYETGIGEHDEEDVYSPEERVIIRAKYEEAEARKFKRQDEERRTSRGNRFNYEAEDFNELDELFELI